jgi:hypothetical protein
MMLGKLSVRTTDPYHAGLAEELAGRHGLAVDITFPREPLPGPREADGLVYDIDYLCLDARQRRELLKALAEKPTPMPTAVVGYGLEEDEAEALRRNGVVVASRLDDALFAELAAKIARVRRAAAA